MDRYKSKIQVSTRPIINDGNENDVMYDGYMAAFQHVENFLELLTNPNQDGRVLICHESM